MATQPFRDIPRVQPTFGQSLGGGIERGASNLINTIAKFKELKMKKKYLNRSRGGSTNPPMSGADANKLYNRFKKPKAGEEDPFDPDTTYSTSIIAKSIWGNKGNPLLDLFNAFITGGNNDGSGGLDLTAFDQD